MRTNTYQRITDFLLGNSSLVLFVTVFLFFGAQSPRFLELESISNIIKQAAFTGIVAVGMTFVLLTAGIDLSVGSNMYLSALFAGLAMRHPGIGVVGGLSSDLPEPLERQWNPDVSVRPAGVMEKCTFCVQRIQDAQDVAKDEDRDVRDGEIRTACSQSCPAEALVFGDLEDPDSRVAQLAGSQRASRLLEDLSTESSVIYLRGGRGHE
jgi:hypothetical protein